MNLDPAIILAVISVLGNIALAIFQFIKDKKKASIDAVSMLVEKAMQLNKQELEVIRSLNVDLQTKIASLVKDLAAETLSRENAEKENTLLKREINVLKEHILVCEQKLGIRNVSIKTNE